MSNALSLRQMCKMAFWAASFVLLPFCWVICFSSALCFTLEVHSSLSNPQKGLGSFKLWKILSALWEYTVGVHEVVREEQISIFLSHLFVEDCGYLCKVTA